jgi:hypothetical protein
MKCGELNYLTPHAFWNITDFGARCEKCETINKITFGLGISLLTPFGIYLTLVISVRIAVR